MYIFLFWLLSYHIFKKLINIILEAAHNTHPPFVLIKINEVVVFKRSPIVITEENTSIEYLYLCPLHNEEDLELNEEFYKNAQCVILVNTTKIYNEQIRCQNAIIPLIYPDDENDTET